MVIHNVYKLMEATVMDHKGPMIVPFFCSSHIFDTNEGMIHELWTFERRTAQVMGARIMAFPINVALINEEIGMLDAPALKPAQSKLAFGQLASRTMHANLRDSIFFVMYR